VQNELELIEINDLAREFLLLDVADNQRGLVASLAQSYADALFPPKYETGIPKPWIRGVLRNGAPAAFLMCAEPTPEQVDTWIWRLLVDESHVVISKKSKPGMPLGTRGIGDLKRLGLRG
jgi:hypothetical protein